MNFRTIALTALATFGLIPTLLAQNVPAPPNLAQLAKIKIGSHGGWFLEIRPDGAGFLQYGSLPIDHASIPKGTFSFQKVYDQLSPHLTDDYPGSKAIIVFLFPKEQSLGIPVNALYIGDRGIVRQIMAKARDNSIPADKNRFNELTNTHPVVPSDAND